MARRRTLFWRAGRVSTPPRQELWQHVPAVLEIVCHAQLRRLSNARHFVESWHGFASDLAACRGMKRHSFNLWFCMP